MSFGEILFGGAVLYFLYKGTTYLKQGTLKHNSKSADSKIRVTGKETPSEQIEKIDQVLNLFASSEVKDRLFAAAAVSQLSELGWDLSKAISQLEQAVSDADEEVRRLSILAVGNIRRYTPLALAQISSFAKSENENIRRAVMWTLVQFKAPESIPVFIDGLSDPVDGVRKLSLYGLKDRGSKIPESAIPQLIKLLQDKDEYLVGDVIEILGEIGYAARDAVPELFRLWNQKEEKLGWRIRGALEKGLGAGADCFIPIFVKYLAMPEEKEGGVRRYTSSEVLASIGDKAISPLIELLKQEEPNYKAPKGFGNNSVEWYAASALKKIGKKSLQPLVEELGNVRGSACKRILYAINHLGIWTEALREPLIALCENSDPVVVAEALKCLYVLAPAPLSDSYCSLFKGKLSSSSAIVREAAIVGLGKYFAKIAVDDFVRFVSDSDSAVRAAAIRGLGASEVADRASTLIPLLADSDENVKIAAVNAIAHLSHDIALEPLIELLSREKGRVVNAALEVLSKFGMQRATDAVNAYNERSLVPELIKTLTDGKGYERESAATKLGELKAEAAIPALLSALSSNESDLREKSLASLKQIPKAAERCGSQLIELYRSTKQGSLRPKILELLGDWKFYAAIPLCIAGLKEEWIELRNSAAIALRDFGEDAKPAIPQLIENMPTDNYYEASVGTLISIGDAAVPALTQAMKKRGTIVKAAYALSEIHTPFALDALVSHLDELVLLIDTADENEIKLLSYTVKRLGQYASEALKQLCRVVKFKEIEQFGSARVTIAEALLQQNDESQRHEALFLLGQALCGGDSWGRKCAFEILEKLGTDDARQVIAENITQKLIMDLAYPSLGDKDNFEAANQLRKIDSEKARIAMKKFADENLPKLIGDLESSKNERNFFGPQPLQGIACLGQYASKAVPVLQKVLGEPDLDQSKRVQVLRALARAGSDEVKKTTLPLLIEQFNKANYHLADDLIELAPRDKQVLEALFNALDGEYFERYSVIHALAQLGPINAQTLVGVILRDVSPISQNASAVLREIGVPALPFLIGALNSESPSDLVLNTIFEIGASRLSDLHLIEEFLEDKIQIRQQVAAILIAESAIVSSANMKEVLKTKAGHILKGALSSNSMVVRAHAYSAMQYTEENSLIDLLLAGLKDREKSVLIAILLVISKIGKDASACVDALREIILGDDKNVASYAAQALRSIGTWQSVQAVQGFADGRVPELIAQLSVGEEKDRLAALGELVRIGDSRLEVRTVLANIIKKTDEPAQLRRGAILAIAKLCPEHASEPLRSVRWEWRDSGVSDLARATKENIDAAKVAAHMQKYNRSTSNSASVAAAI